MKETNYEAKLKNFIFSSSLSDNQKLLWNLFIKISDEDENEAVYEAAIEEKDNIKLLTEHLRDKIWDMRKRDVKAWEKLTEDEGKYAEILE